MDLEHDLPKPREKPFYAHFSEELQSVEKHYDYIFINYPPSFFHAPKSGVFGSNHIIVPANPNALSITGFHLLIEKLESFRKHSLRWREDLSAPTPQALGFSINAVKPGTNIDAPLERFDT